MWTKIVRRLSLKVKTGKTNIRFSLPLISLVEPYNDAVDFLVLISTIFPFVKVNNEKGRIPIKQAVKLFKSGEVFVGGLFDQEPFEIVDVETVDADVKIALK